MISRGNQQTMQSPKTTLARRFKQSERRISALVGRCCSTGYTAKAGSPEWLKLDDGAPKFIAEKNVNTIGFDAPSLDHGEISASGKLSGFAAHRILLPKSEQP